MLRGSCSCSTAAAKAAWPAGAHALLPAVAVWACRAVAQCVIVWPIGKPQSSPPSSLFPLPSSSLLSAPPPPAPLLSFSFLFFPNTLSPHLSPLPLSPLPLSSPPFILHISSLRGLLLPRSPTQSPPSVVFSLRSLLPPAYALTPRFACTRTTTPSRNFYPPTPQKKSQLSVSACRINNDTE